MIFEKNLQSTTHTFEKFFLTTLESSATGNLPGSCPIQSRRWPWSLHQTKHPPASRRR